MVNSTIKMDRIKWEIESDCNLRCRHCFVGNRVSENKTLSYEEAVKIVDRLESYGTQHITFTTMEPLLFENIDKLVAYCTSKGIMTEIFTNGVLLADYSLAEKLVESGVKSISISMEGISEETNDYIRGKGTFKSILKALENLKLAQSSRNRVNICIQMTLNRLNAMESENIPAFFNSLPIDSLHIGDISEDGNCVENTSIILPDDEFNEKWEVIIENYAKLKEKNFLLVSKSFLPYECICFNIKYGTDFIPLPPNCTVFNNSFSLMSNGDMIPCIGFYKKENPVDYPVTKFVDEDIDVKEIENYKSELSAFVEVFKNGECCKGCYYKPVCIPCPATIPIQRFRDKIYNRCSSSRHKINAFFNDVKQNLAQYKILINQGVIFKNNERNSSFKKVYSNGSVNEKHYELSSEAIEMIERIYEDSEICLSYFIRKKYFQEPDEVVDFFSGLLLEDFISIRRI